MTESTEAATTTTTTTTSTATTRPPGVIVAALSVTSILVALVQTTVAPLLPAAPRLLDTTPQDASWLVIATLLGASVASPIAGRLGDMYGKRRVMLWALAVLVLGSLLCAVTSDIGPAIAGRGLQGVALAVVPLALSLLREWLPAADVPRAVAVVGATLGTGAAIGNPAAAVAVEFADYHAMFWATSLVALACMVLVHRLVPESRTVTPSRFDLLGAVGLTAALVLLLLAVARGPVWGWASPTTGGCMLGGVLVLLGWGRHQLGRPAPLVDLRSSRQRPVLVANLSAALVGFAIYANPLATTLLVQEPTVTGYGPGASTLVGGLCLLPGGLAMLALTPLAARIASSYGNPAPVLAGCLVLSVGYLLRVVLPTDLTSVVVLSSVAACGSALAYSALSLMVMAAVRPHELAAANGLNTLMRIVGQALCGAAVAGVLATLVRPAGGRDRPTLGAYHLVFGLAAAAALAAAGLVTWHGFTRRRARRAGAAQGRQPARRRSGGRLPQSLQ